MPINGRSKFMLPMLRNCWNLSKESTESKIEFYLLYTYIVTCTIIHERDSNANYLTENSIRSTSHRYQLTEV